MYHDMKDCKRTLCLYKPGQTIPGVRCTYHYIGRMPCTGTLRCMTCGQEKKEHSQRRHA